MKGKTRPGWAAKCLAWAAACAFLPAWGVPDVFVDFPDPMLEQGIRVALNKPKGKISIYDMEMLVDLDIRNKGVTDLTGLETATALEELRLANNSIEDISPLAGLLQLEELYLQQNRISDLSPLAGLTGLVRLRVDFNWISDVAPLAGLINLRDRYYEGPRPKVQRGLALSNNYIDVTQGSPAMAVIEGLDAIEGLTVGYLPQREYMTWGGWPIRPDCSVDTCEFMGVLDVRFAPWVFCDSVQSWFWVPENVASECQGWIYMTEIAFDCGPMWIVKQDGSQWCYCHAMKAWLWMPRKSLQEGHGWAYRL
jgi:hypothetical protein